MQSKKSFILYDSYFEQLSMLSMEERGQLVTAIYEYRHTGKLNIEPSPVVMMAFSFIRSNMDRDNEEYEERCAQNRSNGAKGGRPRKMDMREDAEASEVITEEDEKELERCGISRAYIEERRQRAEAYAAEKGISPTHMIQIWWEKDRLGIPRSQGGKNNEDEEWFKAKLAKQFGADTG